MVSLTLYTSLLVLFLTETHFFVAGCSRHADCDDGQYCCLDMLEALYNFWVHNCQNESCATYCSQRSFGSDCQAGECCVNGVCETHCCKHNDDCAEGKFCCKESSADGSSFERLYCNNTCLGTHCKQHTDCAYNAQVMYDNTECCNEGVCSFGLCHNECNHHYECDRKQYCCIGRYTQYCNESCPTNDSDYKHDCSLWGDCGQPNNNCCKKESNTRCQCTRNCTGRICRDDKDCAWPDECCGSNWHCTTINCPDKCEEKWQCKNGDCCKKRSNMSNYCVHECVGEPCTNHRDCIVPGECCNLDGFCTQANHSCRKECHSQWDCSYRLFCCDTDEIPYKYCDDHCPRKPTTLPTHNTKWHYDTPASSFPTWETTLATLFVFFLLTVPCVVWLHLKRTRRDSTVQYISM